MEKRGQIDLVFPLKFSFLQQARARACALTHFEFRLKKCPILGFIHHLGAKNRLKKLFSTTLLTSILGYVILPLQTQNKGG